MGGRWFKRVLHERLIIHTLANLSIEGLLTEVGKDGIVLKTAKMANTDLAGDIYIPREQVAFVQRPG